MTRIARTRRILHVVATAVVAAVTCMPSPAHAGSYGVTDLGGWTPASNNGGLSIYQDGGLMIRNVLGNFSSPRGASAAWRFSTPPTTSVSVNRIFTDRVNGGPSWKSSLYQEGGGAGTLFACGGGDSPGLPECTGYGLVTPSPDTAPPPPGGDLVAIVQCNTDTCPNTGSDARGQLRIQSAALTINDNTPPSVTIAGGSAATDKWIGGTRTLTIAANDATGIRTVQPVVDGRARPPVNLDCVAGARIPCPNTDGAAATVELAGLADGTHRLAAQAIDSASNPNVSAQRTIKVDNTPPTPPEGIALDGGAGWRTTDAWTVRWTNPAQAAAPLAGVRYAFCPPGVTPTAGLGDLVASTAMTRASAPTAPACAPTVVVDGTPAALENLQAPGRGLWNLYVWLLDDAGNATVKNAAVVEGVGFDDTPPGVAASPIDPRDPSRVTAKGTDPESGVTGGSIEVRRRGSSTWRRVASTVKDGTISGRLPDRRLPRGRWVVRVNAANPTGLSGSVQLAKAVKFPIRLRSKLTAGRPSGNKLLRSTSPRIGQRIKLRGRLTVKNKPLRNRTIAIASRTSVQGASFAPAGTVKTDKRGRYQLKLRPGPARTVRLSWAGTARIADGQASVQVRTRARLGLRPSARRVRNGDTVTFRGQVRGGTIPPDGVQIALQVFQRGKWQPFGTPVSDAQGRFAFDRRFETIADTTRFRFRAVVLKGATYPFFGRSPARRVTVVGGG